MLDEIYFVGIALKEEDTLCQEPFSFFCILFLLSHVRTPWEIKGNCAKITEV